MMYGAGDQKLQSTHCLTNERGEEEVASHTRTGKHILIYGINYSPEPIGVGRYTGELGAHLLEQGSVVDVVTAVPHYPGWAPRDGYRNRYEVQRSEDTCIIRCPLLLKRQSRGLWRLLAPLSFAITSAPIAFWRILAARPDTVLCVEPTLLCAPVALVAAKFVSARTVLHVQDLEIDAAFAVGHLKSGVLARAALWFEKMMLRRFDSIVTISNRMRERIEEKGAAADRVAVIRNWVDLEKIRPLAGRSRFREELELPDDKFVVLYAGNIGPKQALSVFLNSAKELVSHARIVFVIAGEGPEKQQLVEAYGRLPNVRFLPIQPEERLCELLSFADVHVLPQRPGAGDLFLPSKLGGMLASGKPCIVMADDGSELHQFLGNGAIILPPGDSLSLSSALRLMFSGLGKEGLESNAERIAALDAAQNLRNFSAILTAET